MAKLNLNDIGTSFQSRQALNENFRLIEQAFENTLSRNGQQPNHMQQDIDLNGSDLINAGVVYADNLNYRGVDLTENLDIFLQNYEPVLEAKDIVLESEQNVLSIQSDVVDRQSDIINRQSNIIVREQNVVAKEASVIYLEQSATNAATTSTTLVPIVQDTLAEINAISSGILEAQAQANAVLGLGLGNAVVNADGDLILTVYDGYFDTVEINQDGNLILEWTVN
jgi:hypothetical protein